jgi:hypothetical protein
MSSMQSVVDHTPHYGECKGYQGDPFDWALAVTGPDGAPADLDGWTWQAWIDTGNAVIPWICTATPDGVELYLRGQDTMRLPDRYCPFDVTGRDPAAGEGYTIAAGYIRCGQRITPPLRGMAPGAVEPHPEAVPV